MHNTLRAWLDTDSCSWLCISPLELQHGLCDLLLPFQAISASGNTLVTDGHSQSGKFMWNHYYVTDVTGATTLHQLTLDKCQDLRGTPDALNTQNAHSFNEKGGTFLVETYN